MKKIIFLSSDTGGGHKASSMAIISSMEEIGDRNIETKIIEFFSEGNKIIDGIIKNFYVRSINKSTFIYELIWKTTNGKLTWNLVEPFYTLIHANIRRMIRKENPDLVVSVHPLVNYITGRILRELKLEIPFIVIITDPVTFHQSWIAPKADFFVVASTEARRRLLRAGVDSHKIKTIGLPIRSRFYTHPENFTALRRKFGLNDKYTVLFTGGGEGGGNIFPVVRLLIKEKLDLQIVVVCGRNRDLKRKLTHLPVKALGFIEEMDELMSVADLMVIKAGPQTIEECIVKGLPVIITSFVPPQEEGNIGYAKKRIRAYYEEDPQKAIQLVKLEYLEKRGKSRMQTKGDAPVYEIAEFIKSLL